MSLSLHSAFSHNNNISKGSLDWPVISSISTVAVFVGFQILGKAWRASQNSMGLPFLRSGGRCLGLS